MRRVNTYAALWGIPATVFLTSCASIEGYARDPETPSIIDAKRNAFFGPDAEREYYGTSDQQRRKQLRDLIVYGQMHVIEYDFDALERALNGTGNRLSLFGDLGVLGLNGIGAITGGTQTKAALAAASGGIVGAQGAISKDLYYQRTLPALLTQMEANRERVRAEIIGALRKSDAEYPLPAAEIDLRRLIRAGSIPASISQITQAATDSKDASERRIDALRDISFSATSSAEALAAWLAPNGKADPTHTAAFQDWLKAQPEATYLTSVPFAVVVRGTDAELEKVRQRALKDPALGISE